MIRLGIKRLFRLRLSGGSALKEVEEEIRIHLELRTEQLMAQQGLDSETAHAKALKRFEGDTPDRKALYQAAQRRNSKMTRRDRWSAWFGDLRNAVRSLLREPSFSVFVILALSLGIGANGAIYGVVDRILIRGPNHVEDPSRMVRFYLRTASSFTGDRVSQWIPVPTFEHVAQSVSTLEGLVQYRLDEVLTGLDTEVRPLQVSTVGSGFFQTLGVRPVLGQLLADEGSAPEDPRIAVVSHGLWVADFGAQSDVIGRSINVDGRLHTVVGVAPKGFTGPDLERVDVWVPLVHEPGVTRNYPVIGRLADGLSLEAASESVAEAHRQGRALGIGPGWADGEMFVAPLSYDDAGKEPAESIISRFLLVMTALVLVIACANVMNLLLARLTRRRAEMSMRLALGAGRWRLMRLHLSESLVLALAGGLISLPVAYVAGSLIRRVLLPQVEWTASPLNGRVLLVILGVVLGIGILTGLLPGLDAGKTDVRRRIESTQREVSQRRSRLRRSLTAAQTALSAVLLIGAGLFTQSYRNIRSTDLGFSPERVVSFELHAPLGSGVLTPFSDFERELYFRALQVVREKSSVASAGLVVGVPLLSGFGMSIHVPGLDSIPALPGGGPYIAAASPGYFETLGTQVLRGRRFSETDLAPGAEAVVIVSESMARLLWPGDDTMDQCMHIGRPTDPCFRVVGVVQDVHRSGYQEAPSMQYYVPLGQESGMAGFHLAVRPAEDVSTTIREVRETLMGLDPAVAYVEVTPLQSVLDPEARPWQLGATVLILCAGLALIVAVIGIYGVLSYLVAQRKQEVGMRMALGAKRSEIRTFFVRTGVGQTAVGLAIGILSALLLTRWVQPLLYDISVADPIVLAGVSAVLLVSSLIACFLPANQASRVDPARCLRQE